MMLARTSALRKVNTFLTVCLVITAIIYLAQQRLLIGCQDRGPEFPNLDSDQCWGPVTVTLPPHYMDGMVIQMDTHHITGLINNPSCGILVEENCDNGYCECSTVRCLPVK